MTVGITCDLRLSRSCHRTVNLGNDSWSWGGDAAKVLTGGPWLGLWPMGHTCMPCYAERAGGTLPVLKHDARCSSPACGGNELTALLGHDIAAHQIAKDLNRWDRPSLAALLRYGAEYYTEIVGLGPQRLYRVMAALQRQGPGPVPRESTRPGYTPQANPGSAAKEQ